MATRGAYGSASLTCGLHTLLDLDHSLLSSENNVQWLPSLTLRPQQYMKSPIASEPANHSRAALEL